MAQENANRDGRQKSGAGALRPYAKPRLIEYGSVAKLTQGTLTRQADSVGAGFRKSENRP